MSYYLGIDAGGSRTRSALCDASGTIICRGVGGPANYLHTERHVLIDSLTLSLSTILQVPLSSIAMVCIGMAGLGRQSEQTCARSVLSEISPIFNNAVITHDARIAWAGGTVLSPGIVLISGTGSIAYGIDTEGRECRAGGYGPLYSDEGSGFAMGRQAISNCLRTADGRSDGSLMVDLICRRLRVANSQQLAAEIAANRFPRQTIALLTEVIHQAHLQGDEHASAIIDQAGRDLADLIIAVASQADFSNQGVIQVAVCGGTVGAVPELMEAVAENTCRRLQGATVAKATLSPLGGALLTAMSAQGCTINPQVIANLRASGEGGV